MKKIFLFIIFFSTAILAQDTRFFGTVTADTLVGFKADTLSYSWGIMDTVTTGDLPGWKVPTDITILEVSGYTDANTTTFNIEERAEATPNTAGTDVMTSDMAADVNQQEAVAVDFTNATIAKDSWLVPTISATGDVALFSVTIRYVKVY